VGARLDDDISAEMAARTDERVVTNPVVMVNGGSGVDDDIATDDCRDTHHRPCADVGTVADGRSAQDDRARMYKGRRTPPGTEHTIEEPHAHLICADCDDELAADARRLREVANDTNPVDGRGWWRRAGLDEHLYRPAGRSCRLEGDARMIAGTDDHEVTHGGARSRER